MSDIYNELTGAAHSKRPPCRVAYTLNNAQPVVCTIIGDQPLFYMDYEYTYDDAARGDDINLDPLSHEMAKLKHEIKELERFESAPLREASEKLAEFVSDRDAITSTKKKIISEDMDALKALLSKSRLAEAYMKFADEHKIEMRYSRQIETAYYDRETGSICINPALGQADQLLLAAQELRRHWQHRQGALIHPLMFHPDNAILINRVQVADLTVSMVRIAWELQLSGEKAAWERIENSSMADLGRAFAREAFLDFRTINNGLAAASVFECWFLSERCRTQDKTLINQMLSDYQGYVFELEQARQAITPTLISALGSMPFGKNYLAEHAMTIIDDAIFTDVRDSSNANFLWFIKFERSFRETEQELQTSSGPAAGDVRSFGTSQKIQDQPDETAAAQVIPLYTGSQADRAAARDSGRLLSTRDDSAKGNAGKASNVVYLRRWSGE